MTLSLSSGYLQRRKIMWADILLSITMSVSEAIGCSYIEKKKKEKMLKELSKIIDRIEEQL